MLLAIEVGASTLGEDLALKPVIYARASVRNLWIVDAFTRDVHVLTSPSGAYYVERAVVPAGGTLIVPGTTRSIRL